MEARPDARDDDVAPCAIEENRVAGDRRSVHEEPGRSEHRQRWKSQSGRCHLRCRHGKVAWLPLEKVDGILKKVKASPDKETEPFAASAGARIPVHDSIHSSERSFTMSINFLSLFPEHSSLMVEAISSSHSSSMVRSSVSQLK